MPININDQDYVAAEKDYYSADSLEEKLKALKKMISHMPGHKGAEKLRQQLTTRRKKLESEITKKKKSGKTTQIGIRKEDMQAVILGKTNTGKSSLLSLITNATSKVSSMTRTTHPIIGMMSYATTSIQIIENPAFNSEYYHKGLTNSADTLVLLIDDFTQIEEVQPFLEKAHGKKIIAFNKIDKLNESEKRKLSSKLQSKKYNFVLISTKTLEGINELKEKIFKSFDKIRVYTKEPGKEKSNKPVILKPNSTVRDVAEKILKGFSKNVKETRIWGPSSKFSGQIIGLKHKLKDLDVVEFRTR